VYLFFWDIFPSAIFPRYFLPTSKITISYNYSSCAYSVYTATELSGPKCQTWMKRSYHHPFIDRSQRNKTENGENNNKLELINGNKEQRQQPIANEEADRDSIKSVKSSVSHSRSPSRRVDPCVKDAKTIE